MTDDQIAEAVAGSQNAQSLLMEVLAPQVKSMVAIRLAATPGQSHLVEDLSQQALIAILENITALKKATVVALKAFASTIVNRKVCDFLRTRRPERQIFSLESTAHFLSTSACARDILPATDTTPRSAAARAEFSRATVSIIAGMKENYRTALMLSVFDQLRVSEIAEQMGLSRAATSMLLHRAMKALQKRIRPGERSRYSP